MGRLGRSGRFAAWIVVVAAVAGAAMLAHAGFSDARGIAGAGVLLALSAMVWLLATTPGGALRLPALVSEVVVLAGMIGLSLVVTERIGFGPYVAVLAVLVNHVRDRPGMVWPRVRAAPWLGNPWRLAPALWHPALWLTALHPLRSALTWAGVGLCVAAAIGALLSASTGFWARGVGLGIWVVVGAVTLRLLW